MMEVENSSFSHHHRGDGEMGVLMKGGAIHSHHPHPHHNQHDINDITYKLVKEIPSFVFQAVNCLNTHLKVSTVQSID